MANYGWAYMFIHIVMLRYAVLLENDDRQNISYCWCFPYFKLIYDLDVGLDGYAMIVIHDSWVYQWSYENDNQLNEHPLGALVSVRSVTQSLT